MTPVNCTMSTETTPTHCLITYNIAHGRGLSLYQGFSSGKRIERNIQRIAALMQHHCVDIAALQEVDSDSHWNKNIDMVELLCALGPCPHGVLGTHTRRTGRRPLNYGNAILSRLPILDWEEQAFGTSSLGEKGFVIALINLGGRILPVINLHLDYKSRRNRIIQVEKVIEFVRLNHLTLNGRFEKARGLQKGFLPIICGDFNSTTLRSDDAVFHLFDFLLTIGHYQLYPKKARTFPSILPSLGLDFVLMPPQLEVVHCEVIRSRLSDHRPVKVNFRERP
ncbi:MAG: endonuclease/exonuclease/phosphatase family protein [Verrucomicrobiota bacterium]|nr:endonuclease/exonuclease/phosphatase family protein [Verrucomicrobiota bacterium]